MALTLIMDSCLTNFQSSNNEEISVISKNFLIFEKYISKYNYMEQYEFQKDIEKVLKVLFVLINFLYKSEHSREVVPKNLTNPFCKPFLKTHKYKINRSNINT